jgi:hypothetical protein
MKFILSISLLFLCSCITITKNYYPKEVVKCDHKSDSKYSGWSFAGPCIIPNDIMNLHLPVPGTLTSTALEEYKPHNKYSEFILPNRLPIGTGTLAIHK